MVGYISVEPPKIAGSSF